MAKKLIIGGLTVILVGVLGLAIYNYTQTNQAMAYGNGGNQGYWGGRSADELMPGSGEQGRAYGKGQTGDVLQSRASDEIGVPDPQAHTAEWSTLCGQVTSVDTTGLTLQTDDGQTLSIDLGPEWFWGNQGVTPVAGERMTAQSLEENGEIKVGQISLEDGTLVQLRDTDGRPLWAGRGGDRQ